MRVKLGELMLASPFRAMIVVAVKQQFRDGKVREGAATLHAIGAPVEMAIALLRDVEDEKGVRK